MNPPPSSSESALSAESPENPETPEAESAESGKSSWFRGLLNGRGRRGDPDAAREQLVELINEDAGAGTGFDEDEKRLFGNILALRGRTVEDVMVPRADIVAISADSSLAEVIALVAEEGHSRLPVYHNTLDDAAGMLHVRDILAWRGRDADFRPARIQRRLLFVAPSMRVMELLLEMRVTRRHMALVVDEYGGVDGLVTIEDLVEEIVGEIEDEHDTTEDTSMTAQEDGTFVAEARLPVEALEGVFGPLLSEDEKEEVDTLGGLVFLLAGRVPIRGELISHASGLEFEVLDANPRQVKTLLVRPPKPDDATSSDET
ncbi:MAG: hemolysin family protein [Rhodospirillales bacterium]